MSMVEMRSLVVQLLRVDAVLLRVDAVLLGVDAVLLGVVVVLRARGFQLPHADAVVPEAAFAGVRCLPP